ncbi:hypothetical protein [Streptomyces sp. NPDC046985]|uniref:hypothetical protein n=1 Tax=Streptomyces sp. NPDC046985 TaxID=3155377 RepID=UPI00340152B1
MRARRIAAGAAAAVLAALLSAGCAHQDGAGKSAPPASSASPEQSAPSGSGQGYADMQKKVDAAESAASAADKDAASDDDR